MFKKLKNYVSSLDIFLKKCSKMQSKPSESQKKEIEKHGRIFKLRDQIQTLKKKSKIWERF